MRRTLLVAVAVVTAVAFTTVTAQAQPELHQFFGAPSLVPIVGTPAVAQADMQTNPVVTAAPGVTVYLPVFLRVLVGRNTAAGFTEDLNEQFQLLGVGSSGMTSGMASAAATLRSFGQSYTQVNNAAEAMNTGGPAGAFQMLGRTGNLGVIGQALMRSDGTGIAYDNASLNAYYIGSIAVTVGATAPLGSRLDMYFGTRNTTGSFSVTGTGQSNGTAFGWNPTTNAPNYEGITGGTPIAGAAPNRVSTIFDAEINVVPEPGTLGLLSLGVLGLIRRRRA